MHKRILLLALVAVPQWIFAQFCPNPQSQMDIHGNNIKARILNGGDLFTNFNEGQFIPNPGPPGNFYPSTIYAAGIWLAGIDPGGNLKLATVDYRNTSEHDYSAGPLSLDGVTDNFTCQNWDRHFKVTGDEVAAFRAALPLSAAELKTQFLSIAGWPGRGNPYFLDVWGFDLPFTQQALAPFHDEDLNGLYDPLAGDYPVVAIKGLTPFVPAEIIWCVFNDQNGGGPHGTSNGKALQVEIQLTVWAFNCSDNPVLNNTLFTSHKIINRATEVTDSMTIGLWTDIDLGCYLDDYLGCNPGLNTMYAYNQDAIDGQPGTSCSGTPTFANTPPVQSITFLSHPLSSFIAPNNSSAGSPPPGTTDPTTPVEIFNYMSGSWRDGTPFTYGGNGYGGTTPTNYLFPDDPADPSGWSMCTANLPLSDRRMLGTTKIGLLEPGKVEDFTVAWAFHPNPTLPCGIGTTFSDVAAIQALYNNDFANVCSPLKAPELPGDSLQLFPNPASGSVVLRYGNIRPLSLQAFDAAGRLVLEKTGDFAKEESILEIASFSAGIYSLQIVTDQGTATKKLAVIR